MARFELSMNERYAPSWGEWEGIREFVQNLLDSDDMGYGMEVDHKAGWLTLCNRGCRLDTSAWLLGKTSKRGTSQRGEHGDGLKVGTLALIRAGVEVKIFNNDEIWTPALERSEAFAGETVLVIRTRKRRADDYGDRGQSDFTVKIKVSKEEWNEYRQKFLPLADITAAQRTVIPGEGSLLIGPEWKGKIFARGIYICTEQLEYGYDFDGLELDRDRQRVSQWDLHYHISALMATLAKRDGTWAATTYAMLTAEQGDVADLGNQMDYRHADYASQIAACFAAEHGKDAVPVADGGEADKVAHFGLQAVVVPRNLGKVLSKTYGELDRILSKALDDSGKRILVADLEPAERSVYRQVINLLGLANVATWEMMEEIRVFEFAAGAAAPAGTYHADSGEIRIRRDVLGTVNDFLGVAIHELAHVSGMGEDHLRSVEAAWRRVAGVLLDCADLGSLLD